MRPIVRAVYPPELTSVAEARRFVRSTLADWETPEAVDDAMLLTSELVTNAVVHAGTHVEVVCRAGREHVQVDVVDGAPAAFPMPGPPAGPDAVRGRGLRLPPALAAAWGVTYEAESKTVWFRLAATPVAEADDPYRALRGWPGFLAEASELLAGTLDEAMLIALAAQLVVPRLAGWCAFYPAGEATLSHLWHADERCTDPLRELLEKVPPPIVDGVRPWAGLAALPADRLRELAAEQAIGLPLRARGNALGVLVLGGSERFRQETMWLVEDLGGRIALGLDNARMYGRQRAASRALQRSLLPYAIPAIPGVEHSVVYEPAGEGLDVGGDFYDVFAAGEGRWRFAIGDVCGTGPEAAAVTGLARHALRLLAGEGLDIAAVIDRLNQAILGEGDRGRLMTLLHGELAPTPDGVRLTLVSAGHPAPLRLTASGEVTAVASPQLLLGVSHSAEFAADTVDLDPGDLLLCVTDGVTERRHGDRLLDDGDGLSRLLAGWTGLSAGAVVGRLRQAVETFDPEPSGDDLAILALRVLPSR